MRIWAISRRGIQVGLKKKGARMMVFMAFVPALLLVLALSLWGFIEQGSETVKALLDTILPFLPKGIRDDPSKYRIMVWTFLFDWFLKAELWCTFILTMTIGPDLISQDLRFNAMPLYFSKPIRRVDYFLGKLGVIGVLVGAIMIAPIALAYFCGLLFSFHYTVIRDTAPLFFGAMVYGVVVVASVGALMLAISSLSRNSHIVGAMFAGFVFVSMNFGAGLDANIDRPWCPLFSYPANLHRVQSGLLHTTSAWRTWAELQKLLFEEAEAKSRQMGPAAFLPLGMQGHRRPNAPPPPNMSPDQQERIGKAIRAGRQRNLSFLEKLTNERYPMWHSAAVLAGLMGLSLLTLSQRVKSLDTLK